MNEAKIVAMSGQSILRYLKRELMEIIEVYIPDESFQYPVKSLVNQKLHNSYKQIRNEALSLVEDDSDFLEELSKLEEIQRKNKKERYL